VQALTQIRALRAFGLDRGQRRAFLRDGTAVFHFPTQGEPAIAMIQWRDERLRCGIITISHVGGGFRDFSRFRDRAFAVAKAFSLAQVELFGAAVTNPRLETLLLRHGFARRTEEVPQILGGGIMETIGRVLQVP